MFWVGVGLFSLGEKLRASAFDELAAALMTDDAPANPVHWRAARNAHWLWYEQETFKDGKWMLTGMTTPIHSKTKEPFTERDGYLDPSVVPAELRVWEVEDADDVSLVKDGQHLPDDGRRARHGRPPSKWLRSLKADELRIWLKTIDAPEAMVSGMSYWTHLTRDHYFDADKIEGLTESEQAKLHAAAHDGY
jgi:hypothetical protein